MAIAGRDAREDLRSRLDLHVHFQADDGFVVHAEFRPTKHTNYAKTKPLCVCLVCFVGSSQRFGCLAPQSCAFSWGCAIAGSSASGNGCRISAPPIGSPACVKPQGTLMPGRPARFTPIV